MYDPVTLDQLRALVAVADEGSFSAAARKLQRVQSAVSTAMSNLELQLGVPIWDRATKIPKLTEQGRAVLTAAGRILREVDGLKRLTSGMALGLEAQVSLCLDALFPLPALIALCTGFSQAFPSVALRIDTQLMTAVSERVLRGDATLGVVSPRGLLPGLEHKALAAIRMVPVTSPTHPLATVRGPLSKQRLVDEVQIVLAERSESGVADQAVLSPRTFRVGDLHTKHEMLRAGLGWGNLPEHLAREDLRARTLVAIRPEAWGEAEHTLQLTAIYRADTTFGPAHRWLLEQLEMLCVRETVEQPPRHSQRARKKPARRR